MIKAIACLAAGLFFVAAAGTAQASPRLLRGHVPAEARPDRRLDRLDGAQVLHLAFGLDTPRKDALAGFLKDVYNPASPNYRHFLKRGEFADAYGPSQADYDAVIAFARAHGLTVTATLSSRLVLGVSGRVADIERAFSIHLFHFRREDNSVFFAPDAEPTVDDQLPLLHIAGLDNFVVIKPASLHVAPEYVTGGAQPFLAPTGSGVDNSYMSGDLRASYAPGMANLTGQGQKVAVFEVASGYFPQDIQNYEQLNGLAPVTLENRLVDGYDGSPSTGGAGNTASFEVPLDIEMAIAMAPGLAEVLVYEGDIPDDIIGQMAADDEAEQCSDSWGTDVDPTTDLLFQQMSAQGQSYFCASGDSGAWITGEGAPTSIDPYMTVVGGTEHATLGAGGPWSQEIAWPLSGGGIGNQDIPAWQAPVSMALNDGSTTLRNSPDVAMEAGYLMTISNDGENAPVGGTSASTPLWAGFMALVNQQAALSGQQPLGFANPALYRVGLSANYEADFHDVTVSNNTNSAGSAGYAAVAGYDLVTGWGSPAGANLVNDLLGLPRFSPTPTPAVSATFTPTVSPSFSVSPTISATFTASPTATPVPTVVVATCGAGTTVNGMMGEPVWTGNYTQITKVALGSNTAFQSASYKVRWDSTYLYVGFQLNNCSFNEPPASALWQGEAFEVFLDMNNTPGTSYGPADFQYIVGYEGNGPTQAWEQNGRTTGVLAANYQLPEEGGVYTAELAIPWTTLGVSPSANAVYGFDIAADLDQSHGTRTCQLVWNGTAQDYTNTTGFGELQLGPACPPATSTPTIPPTSTATMTSTISPTFTASPSSTGTPSSSPTPESGSGCGFLDQQSAGLVLGQSSFSAGLPNQGGAASAGSMDYPTDVFTDGRILLVSDTQNNRVLLYNPLPSSSGNPLAVVIGQQGGAGTSPNQGGAAGANTLSSPHGVYWDGSHLFIADTGNSRVLVFNGLPTANNPSASLVIGEQNLTSTGSAGLTGGTVNQPLDVKGDGTHVFIADSRNSRVLIYNTVPTANGAIADEVVGQPNSESNSPNQNPAGGLTTPGQSTLSQPVALASAGGKLFIADENNSRVLIYDSIPTQDGANADVVVGQPNFTSIGYHCAANSLGGSPLGLYSDGTRLFIASSANRVLVYNAIPTVNGASADVALGQPSPASCGLAYNGASATNLWPLGLSGYSGDLFVADGDQNRVLGFQCQNIGTPQPSATASPTASKSPTMTPSMSPSATWTSTRTPTSSPSPTPSSTRTPSPTAVSTGTASATPTASPTSSRTSSPVPSATASPSRPATPAASPTPSRTSSPIPSATASPSRSATPTASPTPSRTSSPAPSATASPSRSATPAASPTPSRTSSQVPSATASPTWSATVTATPASQQTPCAAPVLLSGSNQSWTDPGSNNSFSQAYNGGSGSDTALIVRTYMQSGVNIGSVTYAGTALTEAAGAYVAYNGYVMQTWWMASPPASSNALVVNFPGTDYPNLTVLAATYRGVNQSAPIGAVANAGATACATSYQSGLTTQGSDSLIDDFLTLSSGGTVGATVSPGTGQSWEELNIAGGSAPAAYDDTLAAGGAGAYTLNYTFSYCLSDRFSQTIEIKAAPCGGGNVRLPEAAGEKLPVPSPIQSSPQNTLLVCPNPAAGSWAAVDYSVGQVCHGSLAVFSMLGRLVESKDLGTLQAGSGSTTLDLAGYPAGIYFVVLQEDGKPAGTFKLAVVH